MPKPHVLIVEDDRSLLEVLAYNIEQAGYEVTVAHDGQDGLNQAQHKNPDLIVLDLMLPVMDGLEVCRRLRGSSVTRDTLVLMLTAKSEEVDQMVGLAMGADDYVTKPFSVRVLTERIKALLRRKNRQPEKDHAVSQQGIVVDRLRHFASADGAQLELTRTEFALLDTLIRQPGRAFSRADLLDAAFDDTLVLERTIDVHIRALRKKLGQAASLIETVRGVGYRFHDPAMNLPLES